MYAPLEAFVQQTNDERKDVVRDAIRTRNYWIPIAAGFTGVAGETSSVYSTAINQAMTIFGATTDLLGARALLTVIHQQYCATPQPITSLAGQYSVGDAIRWFAHPIDLPIGQQLRVDFVNGTAAETGGRIAFFAQETRTLSEQDVNSKARDAFADIDQNLIELDFDLVMDFNPAAAVSGVVQGSTVPFDRALLVYGASVESPLLVAGNIPMGTIYDDQTRENWSQVNIPMWAVGGISNGYSPILRFPVPIYLPPRARLYGNFSTPTNAGAITFKCKTA
jgi:hypothetical protein